MPAHPFRPRSVLCDTHVEEVASAYTHVAGTALALGASAAMLAAAAGDPYKLVAATVFGITLSLLYGVSTLYHFISRPRAKRILQALDHACIYLLIAGSYTPLALVALRGPWGWSILAVVWSLAVVGVVAKTLLKGRRDSRLSTALYIGMGWLALVAIGPITEHVPGAGVAWIVAGGVFYTGGVVFFAWQQLHFNHAIWHLFVIAGSLCHVVSTMFIF